MPFWNTGFSSHSGSPNVALRSAASSESWLGIWIQDVTSALLNPSYWVWGFGSYAKVGEPLSEGHKNSEFTEPLPLCVKTSKAPSCRWQRDRENEIFLPFSSGFHYQRGKNKTTLTTTTEKKKQKNSGFSRETTCLKRCHYRWERWEFHDQFWQLHTHQSSCGKFSNLEWGTRKSYVNWQNVMFFKLSLKKQDYSFNEENKQIDKDHVFNSC